MAFRQLLISPLQVSVFVQIKDAVAAHGGAREQKAQHGPPPPLPVRDRAHATDAPQSDSQITIKDKNEIFCERTLSYPINCPLV